jgi:hypothetical protein
MKALAPAEPGVWPQQCINHLVIRPVFELFHLTKVSLAEEFPGLIGLIMCSCHRGVARALVSG